MAKLGQIVQSQQALKNLLEVKLPIKIAYKVSKLVNKIQPELVIYEEQRNALIKKLGVSTNNPEKPEEIQVKPENMPEFTEDYNKLVEIEVDLKFGDGKEFEKIKLDDLGEIALTSQDLLALEWLIE